MQVANHVLDSRCMTHAQLAKLMKEADPDGSGEIDFEEVHRVRPATPRMWKR